MKHLLIFLLLISTVSAYNFTVVDNDTCMKANFKVINNQTPYIIYGDCYHNTKKNIEYCNCTKEIIINSKTSNKIEGDYYIGWLGDTKDNSLFRRQFSVTTYGNDPFRFEIGEINYSSTGASIAGIFVVLGIAIYFIIKKFKKMWDEAKVE